MTTDGQVARPIYPDDPEGAGMRRMNVEFGRRIRSFLTGGAWWDIAQLARSEMEPEDIWQIMLAGIDDYKAEDLEFAKALNWGASRREIDLSNVETYSYPGSNWWYADQEEHAPGYRDATLVIVGKVAITLREQHSPEEVEVNATDFGEAMIHDDVRRGVIVRADREPQGGRVIVQGKVVIGPKA